MAATLRLADVRLLAGVTLLVSLRCRSGARRRYAPNTAPTTTRAAPDRRVGVRLSQAPDVAGCVTIPSYSPADSESAGFLCIAAYVENSLFCRDEVHRDHDLGLGREESGPSRQHLGLACGAAMPRLCAPR
jgi:hypothetical protein